MRNFAAMTTHRQTQGIEEFNTYFRQPTTNQLVAVGDLSRTHLSLFDPTDFGMYCIVLMDAHFGTLAKDGSNVNYGPQTIFWLRPGQVVSMQLDYAVRPQGWMLAFRPELLEKSGLGRDFYMFSYFNRDVDDALKLTSDERGVIMNCFANIFAELQSPRDYLSNHMLRLGIGHLLSYVKRFFERQYDRDSTRPGNMQNRLDTMIDNYLSSGLPAQQGQPTVAWCAAQFSLSPNYFGDLVRREMHISAQDYIQQKIIVNAQSLLKGTSMSVNEIAEELGFAYPNHFTRMFRRNTGQTPMQFRNSVLGNS